MCCWYADCGRSEPVPAKDRFSSICCCMCCCICAWLWLCPWFKCCVGVLARRYGELDPAEEPTITAALLPPELTPLFWPVEFVPEEELDEDAAPLAPTPPAKLWPKGMLCLWLRN